MRETHNKIDGSNPNDLWRRVAWQVLGGTQSAQIPVSQQHGQNIMKFGYKGGGCSLFNVYYYLNVGFFGNLSRFFPEFKQNKAFS